MTVFHLGIDKKSLQGATLAILPGDPQRAEKIAEFLEQPKHLASQREFTSYLGWHGSIPIVVCSTGIGGPSTSIVVEELAQLGVDTFLRIGTTGAIQPHIRTGDIIISQASVRLDGASSHFAPAAFPAASYFSITAALVEACQAAQVPTHVGITASSDTFYPGQERYETHTGYVLNELKGSMDEWQALGVLNFEMESATLFTQCASQGLKAGCLAAVIVNRYHQEIPDAEQMKLAEQRAIELVIDAAKKLIG